MAKTPANESIYRVIFMSQGEVFEIYARSVSHGSLLGFVEVEQLLFGERTTVVVDPSEEKLKSDFEGVRRFFVPMHAVVRIDEVEKKGPARITKAKKGSENVANFPTPIFTPGDDK